LGMRVEPLEGGHAMDGSKGTAPRTKRGGQTGPGVLMRARSDNPAPVARGSRVLGVERLRQSRRVKPASTIHTYHPEHRGGAKGSVQRFCVAVGQGGKLLGVLRTVVQVVGNS